MTDPKDWPLPMTGGLYLRDPVTGALTLLDPDAEKLPAPAADAVADAAPAALAEPAPEDPAPRARKVKEA